MKSKTKTNQSKATMSSVNKKAAVYVRVSGESDNRTASLSTQTDACRALALQNGFSVDDDDIFVERRSGRYLRERAELEKLRALVDEEVYSAVVFYQLDRFSRGGAKHLWVLLPHFRERGITLLSVKDDLSDNPYNNIALTIKAELASQEIEHIRDRVQRGLQKKVESGKHPGNGGNLYGYRMDKESWKREIYEPEAEIIREIFADAANGVSTKKIASNLAAKGIPSLGESLGRKKASHKWFSAGVARIIRNRSYIGETVINRSDKEVDLGEVTPPIVSDDFLNGLSIEIRERESEQIDIPSLLELQLQFQWGDPGWSEQQKRAYLLNWGFSIFIDGRTFEIRMRSGKLLRSFDESSALIAKGNAPCGDETISKEIVMAGNAAIAQS